MSLLLSRLNMSVVSVWH